MNQEIAVGLASYSTIALLICCQLLYYAHLKYDWCDWQINRQQILSKVMRRVFLWPFYLVCPKQLINPIFDFKPSGYDWEDPADLARRRYAFMDNPPSCGSTISISGECGWASAKGEFLFPSQVAHAFAVKKWRENRTLPGLRGTIWWLGLRDDALGEKSPVPELLINFDKIVNEMIDAGVGQARCPECNTIYSMTEIVSETASFISYVYRFLKCPEGHILMRYEFIHLFTKRSATRS